MSFGSVTIRVLEFFLVIKILAFKFGCNFCFWVLTRLEVCHSPFNPDALPVAVSSQQAQTLAIKELQEKTEWLAEHYSFGFTSHLSYSRTKPQHHAVLFVSVSNMPNGGMVFKCSFVHLIHYRLCKIDKICGLVI